MKMGLLKDGVWSLHGLIHLGSYESRKTFERKFTFQIGILNPHVINERFSFN